MVVSFDRVVEKGLDGGFLFGGVREASLAGVGRREEITCRWP